MKKIVRYFIPIIALSLFSCSDYLDVNTSENNPQLDQISPVLSLSAAQTNTYRTQCRNMNQLGNLFMNNWGYNVNSFAIQFTQELSLEIDNEFYTPVWDNIFTASANYSRIINDAKSGYEHHIAIARIMKTYHMQYMVDLYGDIPYFEAHKGASNTSPKYDDDKVIYRDFIVQLDKAIDALNLPAGTPVGAEDAILGGNLAGWKKFANTLKLRILLRQSGLTDTDSVNYLTQEFAKLASSPDGFITTDVIINPGYSKNDSAAQNPFFNQYFEADGSTDKALFRQYRASKFMGDLLNSTSDPRRGQLFELIGGNVVGVFQGDVAQVNGGTAPTAISSLAKGAGKLVSDSNQNGYIMLLAESLLLQAEAAHRGYLAGNAQQLFDNAITASCTQLGVSAGGYITSINAIPGKGYGAGSSSDKIKAIMYQKNIALQGGVNAIESFIEHTRAKVIDSMIPLVGFGGTTKANKPRVLLYPTSELVGNTANVPQRSLNDCFVKGPFWLQ